MALTLPNNWEPRPYQYPLWSYLINGGKRGVAVWHRRAGKDDLALHFAAVAAMTLRAGNYWHMLPMANQCRRAVWEAINPHTGKRRIDEAFPPEICARKLDNEMFIEFHPNPALGGSSTWQLVGSDNYESLIGSPPVGLVFSEWATSNPHSFAYLEPILNENSGWALFIGTPRGTDNHLARLYETAREKPDWFAELLSADTTGVFTPPQLEDIRQTQISLYGAENGQALYDQEYRCSFSAGFLGSYYGRLIEQADQDGRIRHVPHDPRFPVFAALDIGVHDGTAIWFFQQQGSALYAIDYIENTDVAADWYVREMKSRPYTYGAIYLPHDANQRHLGATNTNSPAQIFRQLGLPNIRVLPTHRVADGINATRMLLPRVTFDRVRCKRGLECLRNYSRQWNDTRKVYSDTPLHDQYSDGADALRYFAMAHTGGNAPKREIKYSNAGIV